MRLLRGRALIRLHPSELAVETLSSGGVVIPATAHPSPREQKIHRGTIVALGAPSRRRRDTGAEIPWGCAPGDEVLFCYAVWLERMRQWDDLAVVAQAEIQAVIE